MSLLRSPRVDFQQISSSPRPSPPPTFPSTSPSTRHRTHASSLASTILDLPLPSLPPPPLRQGRPVLNDPSPPTPRLLPPPRRRDRTPLYQSPPYHRPRRSHGEQPQVEHPHQRPLPSLPPPTPPAQLLLSPRSRSSNTSTLKPSPRATTPPHRRSQTSRPLSHVEHPRPQYPPLPLLVLPLARVSTRVTSPGSRSTASRRSRRR